MTCLNQKSIIDEKWSQEYEPSIYIELLDYYDTIYDGKKFCFRRDELEYILNTGIYQVAKWFIDPVYAERGYVFNADGWVIDPVHPEQKHAFGYPSKVEKYIRVPIDEGLTFYVLQENLETILLKDNSDFIGIVIDTTRVGKDYTISGVHGQLPKVQIYYLVPRVFYERSPEKVYNEIYNVIFKIKFSNIMTPNLKDIVDLNGTVMSNVDSGASINLQVPNLSGPPQPISIPSLRPPQPIMNRGGRAPRSMHVSLSRPQSPRRESIAPSLEPAPERIFRSGDEIAISPLPRPQSPRHESDVSSIGHQLPELQQHSLYITEDDVDALLRETDPDFLEELIEEYRPGTITRNMSVNRMINIVKTIVRQNPRIPLTQRFIENMDVGRPSTNRLIEILEAYQLSLIGDRDTLENRIVEDIMGFRDNESSEEDV
jgi:hypothetical protein